MKSYVNANKATNLIVKNARIIDGTGATPYGPTSIFIKQGRIAKIGKDLSAIDASELDAAGASVLPGLIDAHVHMQSVPGSVYREDSDDQLRKLRHHHLRSYLACGVTTVLDNAISASMLREFQGYLNAGGIGPRLYALAPAFYPPGGYLDNGMLTPYWGPHWKPAGNNGDVQSLFNEYEGLDNIVGVKTLLEPGFGMSANWPIHSLEMQGIIVAEAAKRTLPIYVHAYKRKEQDIGLDMGAHNFAHSGFLKGSPSKAFIDRMKNTGTYLTTTLSSTLEQILVKFDMDRLDDELLKLTVPEEELDTARNLKAWNEMLFAFAKISSPKWMPSFVLKAFMRLINMKKQIKSSVANASKAIYKMHEAGIPIVVGTDTSNIPLFLNFFHGPSTIREIELLGEAGLPPIDVITSATKIPAEMMGIQHHIGTVEVGKLADLIIVRDDPLKDLTALRSLQWIIKDGEARTPTKWMQ